MCFLQELLITFLLFITLIKFIDEPGKNYSKMRGINNSKSMIGLSKEELENKSLYEIPIKETIPKRSIGIVLPKNMISSFATQKFIDIVKQ